MELMKKAEKGDTEKSFYQQTVKNLSETDLK